MMVLVAQDCHWVHGDAALQVAKLLPQPWPLLASFAGALPTGARAALYSYVSDNRYKIFGERQGCRWLSDSEDDKFLEDRFLEPTVMVLSCLASRQL